MALAGWRGWGEPWLERCQEIRANVSVRRSESVGGTCVWRNVCASHGVAITRQPAGGLRFPPTSSGRLGAKPPGKATRGPSERRMRRARQRGGREGGREIKRGANTGEGCSPFIGPFTYFPSYVLFPGTRTFS